MSDKLRILLVEDDPDTTLRMEALIYSLGYNLIRAVDNSEDAIRYITQDKPDVLVMDIDINGKLNGIEVVEKIKDQKIPVVFVTGHDDDEHYQKAQATQPVAYLVKPFNKFTFQTALENALVKIGGIEDQLKSEDYWDGQVFLKNCFFIKKNNLIHKVKVDDIRYIQSEGNYCDIFSAKKHAVKISLTQLLKKLPPNLFIRVHQRYVVQAELIESINMSDNLMYVDGQNIPIGPRYKEDILKIAERL